MMSPELREAMAQQAQAVQQALEIAREEAETWKALYLSELKKNNRKADER